MTINEINVLNEKAKYRKDGVYSYNGNFWVVKNNSFIAYAKPNGQVMQRFGAFDHQIGIVSPYERKQELIKWLKLQR